jgi:endoglucanase
MTSDLSLTVFQGQSLPAAHYSPSDENVRIADFTLMQAPGNYVIVVDDLGKSVPFSIKNDVLIPMSKAAIKAFYYNRASMDILSEFAGIYAREMGHPDTAVVVHPSAASAIRPAGMIISTPGGWYDAGDYNKYIVNSGISTFTLLSAYETYPDYFDTLKTNIPESNNDIPDILDEALWNIKWMMTMQDTNDGGVYHKTTEAQFSSFVMPSKVTSTRYVTAKGTAAALDFAAIMAMTARIYKKYLPDLAVQALKQAVNAWQWAKINPDVPFTNPPASGIYPEISTGEYSDGNFDDEFSWCAAELYITTRDAQYYNDIGLNATYDLPGWGGVKTLGLLSLIVNKDSLTADADTTLAKSKLLEMVAKTKSNIAASPYRIPGDFYFWGGNNTYANWGMLFMQAFRITQNATYFNAALSSLDYLLGRNATSYCFVTGAGTKHPMHIHHRISGSDGIAEPVPGLLVGGSNPGNLTDCGSSQYPSTLPAKAYADLQCSCSTNEVAINWNAPLAFLAGAIQCEYLKNFTDKMPDYFVISPTKVDLPYKKGNSIQIVIEGNTDWELSPSADWIELDTANGIGSGIIQVNSKTDNPDETARSGTIYVYSQGIQSDSISVTQNGVRKSFRIEAEDYTGMLGLQTESTSDYGGGLDLGYVDVDDWVTYNLDITVAGIYNVIFRHAGYEGDFDVSIDNTYLQTITFPATSGWQDWTSNTTQINLPEGQHVMKFTFNKIGVNLNWMQFDWTSESGVDNIVNDDGVNVYPMPVDKYLNIEFNSSERPRKIQLLSLDGKIILSLDCPDRLGEVIDVSNLNAGIYILRIIFNTRIYTKKIIINQVKLNNTN